jgi:hypothetical protein
LRPGQMVPLTKEITLKGVSTATDALPGLTKAPTLETSSITTSRATVS